MQLSGPLQVRTLPGSSIKGGNKDEEDLYETNSIHEFIFELSVRIYP